MKKVSILTLPLHTNFGGNLQAYALYQVLRNKGFDVEIIQSIQNKHSVKSYLLNYLKQTIKKYVFLKKANFMILPKEYKIIKKNHENFIKKNLKLSALSINESNLSDFKPKIPYFAVIVGSDQVWRKAYISHIENYFLDFITDKATKKIAYAASFGLDEWQFNNIETNKIAALAQDFDYISVREDSAVDLCNQHLKIKPDHVLDPTLLLDKNDYLKLCNDVTSQNRGKIFSYILDNNIEKEKLIREISEKLRKEIFSISINKSKDEVFIQNIDEYVIPSVEKWIKSFDDAEFIVTDSFHGMVFSIIFNKPFIAIINKGRGATRFNSLAKVLNIEERIFSLENIDINDKNLKLDYSEINERIKQLKEKSIQALYKALD